MKLLCKLHWHKYKIVKRLSGGDYPKYVEKCKRCDKTVIATYNALGNPFVINRSDLDESENVFPEKWLDKHMDWGGEWDLKTMK